MVTLFWRWYSHLRRRWQMAIALRVFVVAFGVIGALACEQDARKAELRETPTLEAVVRSSLSPEATSSPVRAGSPVAVTPAAPTSAPIGLPTARVIRVIDGDTIEIEGGQRVRYIGMDTPESTTERECFGVEATGRNTELVLNKTVALERDVSETDRYGRLLRYVWADGQMVNEVLVREGYAQVATFPPDVKYVDRLLGAQREAREQNLGLWAACSSAGPTTPPLPTAQGPGDNCHPSYPDVCIPPPPPDLDCNQIPYRDFRVLPPDPHRLDGDRDGTGCES
ncbi:MAG TPA: thermonuclease family protein [Dehalococcoidia bacterium]|nr:thermonuclease family protein [Dehalococcoidia bacterium]